MPKSSSKFSSKRKVRRAASTKRLQSPRPSKFTPKPNADAEQSIATSKQGKIIAMLSSESGSTIPAIMEKTGWQMHSVRGFLAGVVRKKLKLRLVSEKVDGQRIYRIDGGNAAKPSQSGHAAS